VRYVVVSRPGVATLWPRGTDAALPHDGATTVISREERDHGVRLVLLDRPLKRNAIATTIARAPPAALPLAKRCFDKGLNHDPRGALATELMAIEESLAAAEWRRAMAGFRDR
jgi:enoyl-CoA hydratase/carnithine racemase